MIILVEALNYRCLRYIKQPLGPFHILVGANATGKTTFLDVIAFLGSMLSDSSNGLDKAVNERVSNFMDLTWQGIKDSFEIAVTVKIPDNIKEKLEGRKFKHIRYEISLGLDKETEEISILNEKVLFTDNIINSTNDRNLFPMMVTPPDSLQLMKTKDRKSRTIIHKIPGGKDNFYAENKGWHPVFMLGRRKSAFANLPDDEQKFPVSVWFKKILTDGVQHFILNSQLMRKASPPGQVKGFKTDGSNLPWVINDLKNTYPDRFHEWLKHLQTALPDIHDIQIKERKDDKHRYIVICYDNNLKVPSWMVSDGTLRFLALTLPAYLPNQKGIFLIEEPENGIHPRAVESLYQSLSSMYDSQVLLASHSPVLVRLAKLKELLCFAKTKEGATDIVLGNEHPRLKQWREKLDLGELMVAGVLDS